MCVFFSGCKIRPEKSARTFHLAFAPKEAQATAFEKTVRTLTGNTVLQGPQGPPGEDGLPGIPGTPGTNGAPGADDTCGSIPDINTCNVTPPPGVPGNQLTTVSFMATVQEAASNGVLPTYQLSAGDIVRDLNTSVMPNNNLWLGFLGPVSNTTSNHPLGINGVVNADFLRTANTVAFNGNYFVWAIGKGDVRTALDAVFPQPGGPTLRNYLIQAGATNALYQMTSNTSFAFIGRYGIGRGNGGLFLEHGRSTIGAALLAGPYLFKNHTPTPTRVALNDILPAQDLTPCVQDDLMHWQTDNGVAHWVCTTNSILLNNHFQTATITGADIANGSIVDINIAPGSIESRHIQDGTILSRHFQNNAIVSEKIANETITSNHVRDGHIEERHFAINGISQESILNGTLRSIHISNGSVSSNSISDNAFQSRHFTNNSILSRHIANNTLEDRVFANDAITSATFKTEGGIRFNNSLTVVGNAPVINLIYNGENPEVPKPSLRIGTAANYVQWVITASNTIALQTPSKSLANMVLSGSLTITNTLTCSDLPCIGSSSFAVNSIPNNALSNAIKIPTGMCIFSFTRLTCPSGWRMTLPEGYEGKAIGISNNIGSPGNSINETTNGQLILNLSNSVEPHMHSTILVSASNGDDAGINRFFVRGFDQNGREINIIRDNSSRRIDRQHDSVSDLCSIGSNPADTTYFTQQEIHSHTIGNQSSTVYSNHVNVLVCCHD